MPSNLRARAEALLGDTFLRSVGVLTGGTVVGQGIVALSMPLLTRLYTPDDFSLLAVYMAVLSLLTVVSCLRLNIAISLPEREEDGANLVALSVMAALALSAVLGALVIAMPRRMSELLGQPDFQPYLWMIPVGVLLASMYSAFQYWASRRKRFGQITRTRITRAVGGSGVQIGAGLFQPSPFGLIFGHMVFHSMGVVGLGRSMWKRDRAAFAPIRLASLKRNFLEHRRFPIFSVPEALLNTAGSQLPILIIAGALAGAEAGFLLLAMRVLGLPMGLIGTSVAQVYLAEAPAKLRAGELGPFTRRAMWSLFKAGAPPLIALGAASPFVFPLVFGVEWARAGWMLAWMTPWFVLQFVASPISMLLHVTARQVTALVLQAFGCMLRVGAVLTTLAVAPSWTIEAYAISGAVFYAMYIGTLTMISGGCLRYVHQSCIARKEDAHR